MKWLRKHMKQIMVAVVLLAMFAFVGGPMLQSYQSSGRGSVAFAKAFGDEISYNDHLMAQNDTAALEALRVNWHYDPIGEMTVDHWHLLADEAERAGIMVSDEEVKIAMQTLLQRLQQTGYPVDYLDKLRATRRITLVGIHRALRRHIAIQKNFARVGSAAIPSEPQIRHYVCDTEDKVHVRFVALDAQRFVDQNEPLTEEAVQAQFDEFKEYEAADSETGYGYGYPRRVKVQYIQASVSKVQPLVEVTFDEAKAYWKKNKAQYKKVEYVEVPEAASKPATTQPTTQPAPEPKKIRKEVQKAFSEARPDIERDIRERKATQLAEQAMRKVTREMMAPWEAHQTDPRTGYKPIPPGVEESEYMISIRDRISKEFGVPLEYEETELVSEAQLNSMPAFSTAAVEGEGTQRMSAAEYAFRVPAFVEQAFGRNSALCLQLYQIPDTPLKGSKFEFQDGRIFRSTSLLLFRVVEARAAEPPASLEEVRSDVERDLRLMRAFERIEPVAKEVYVVASRLGLEPAVERFDDLQTDRGVRGVASPEAFARRVSLDQSKEPQRYLEALQAGEGFLVAPNVRGVGDSEDFVDACFEMTGEGWQPQSMGLPVTERTQAATTQPAAIPTPTVRLLSIPKLKKWFVVELIGTETVDRIKYDTEYRMAALSTLNTQRGLTLRFNWFDPENIETRCRFERIETALPTGADEGLEPTEEPERPEPLRL